MSKKHPAKPLASKPAPSKDLSSFFSSKRIAWIFAAIIALAFAIYFLPNLQGKVLASHDTDQYQSMYKELKDYKENGQTILWTTRLFSGMPATLIGIPTYNVFTYVWGYLNEIIPSPLAEFLLIAFSVFFIFRVLGFGYLECLLAAILMGFGSTNFISVSAGHLTKVRAIAMVPVLLGSGWMVLNGRLLWGGLIFTIGLGLQISFNHIQITYYTFLVLGILYVSSVVHAIISKQVKLIISGTGLLIAGTLLSVALNSALMFNTLDYSKESIRGERILPEQVAEGQKDASKSGDQGVGIDYATNWSQGIGECMTFLIPNFYGGGSSGALDETSNTYKILSSKGVAPAQAAGFVSQLPLYWGTQPFVAGPIYFGSIVILLFVIGLFLLKGKYKWWMLAAIIFTLLVSFGKNTLGFYKILYNTLPMFNKFRSPTMFLALTQMLMAGMGVMGIAMMIKGSISKEVIQRAIKVGGGIVLGICVLMAVLGGSLFSFANNYKEDPAGQSNDQRFIEQLKTSVGDEVFANEIYEGIKKDRKSMMSKDAIRSAIFVALAIALLYLASISKLNIQLAIVGVTVIALADLWGVNKRYLKEDNFGDKTTQTESLVIATQADEIISNNGKDARMIDFSVNMFNDASPGYFHHNIGGYHPAKLRRYQDLIERGISVDLQSLNASGLSNIPVLNMLNTKFIKTGPDPQNVVMNPGALGRCWLVDSVVAAATDLEEINGLQKFDLRRNAVVHKEFSDMLKGYVPSADLPGDTIYVSSYEPDKITYKYKIAESRVAVFSEIIYKPNIDWTSTIDDKEQPHFRANYVLRAMHLPAGEHTITFTFLPRVFSATKAVSLAASGIFLLLIGFSIFRLAKPGTKPENIS